MYYIWQQLNNRTDNNRYWSDHHAYTQNIRPSTQDNHENSHNHSELNDLLGFLDCGIDSVSSSSTFLELKLEPEERKYSMIVTRIVSQPFLNACTNPLIYYSLLIIIIIIIIINYKMEDRRKAVII